MAAKELTKFYIGADWYVDLSVYSKVPVEGAYVTSSALTAALVPYLKSADASSTYLTIATAGTTYLTQTSAASTYLTKTDAASTYVTNTSLTTTLGNYVTTSSQATTLANYVSKDFLNTTLGSYVTSDSLTTTLGSYATTDALNAAIASITKLTISVVDELPATGEENIIYLVPNGGSTGNVKNEYLWIDGKWELIGTTEVDLSDYVTTSALNTKLADYVTTTQLNTKLADYVTSASLTSTLSGYVTTASLTSTLAPYAKTAEITTAYQSADAATLSDAKTYADTKLMRTELTQAAYDALSTKDPNTLYIING